MKKIFFMLFFSLILPLKSSEGIYYLKLRADYHTEFLRVVLEGTESVISQGVVNQAGRDIVVRFPSANIVVREEKVPVAYRIEKNTVIFSPGYFSGLRVFSLKYPSRLVIDVYQKPQKKEKKRLFEALRERLRKKAEPRVRTEQPKKIVQRKGVKTVVVDPGHGGYEAGLISEDYKEKNVVLGIAKRLEVLINKGSNRSLLTRKSDQFVAIGERLKFAHKKNADIFLSLHVGNHEDIVLFTPLITESVPSEVEKFLVSKGQEDYLGNTEVLRDALQEAIVNSFGSDMVSTRPLPYSILSEIEAAALIIELPSFGDAQYIADLKTELANTIYRGISLYEEKTAN